MTILINFFECEILTCILILIDYYVCFVHHFTEKSIDGQFYPWLMKKRHYLIHALLRIFVPTFKRCFISDKRKFKLINISLQKLCRLFEFILQFTINMICPMIWLLFFHLLIVSSSTNFTLVFFQTHPYFQIMVHENDSAVNLKLSSCCKLISVEER